MKILKSIAQKGNKKNLKITWCIHNTCNYRCDYCCEYNYNGSEKWLTKEIAFKFIDFVDKHYYGKLDFDTITISFTGGEPTLGSFFAELCHYIASKKMVLGLSTNGSAPSTYWGDIAGLFDWLAFSFHPGFACADSFLKSLKEINQIEKAPVPSICLMMPPDRSRWNKSLAFVERIKKECDEWFIDYVRIRNDFGQKKQFVYSQEQQEFFEQNGSDVMIRKKGYVRPSVHSDWFVSYDDESEELLRPNSLINKKMNCFKGWFCNIGVETLEVDYFGEIRKAGSCAQGKKIGSIQDLENLHFPVRGVICRQDFCSCVSNLYVSKNRV